MQEMKYQVEHVKGGQPLFANVTRCFPREREDSRPILCSLKVWRSHHCGLQQSVSQPQAVGQAQRQWRRLLPRPGFTSVSLLPVWVVCSQRRLTHWKGARCLHALLFTSRSKRTGRDMKGLSTSECDWGKIRRRRWCRLMQDDQHVAKTRSHPRVEKHCR